MSEIINSGEGGNNTRALLSRLDADVLAHLRKLQKQTPAAVCRGKQGVESAGVVDARVPCSRPTLPGRHLIPQNTAAECRSYNLNTVFSVLGNVGDDATSLLRNPANSGRVDGVHPTAEGYGILAVVIYQTILDHQLPTSKIVCFGDSITLGTGRPGEGTATGGTYPARLAGMLNHPAHSSQ